jgi:tetratricopeptide (TPR) repeat protein
VSVIKITERSRLADRSFEAWVSFDDGGEHDVRVSDPSAAREGGEGLLAWYFEEHLRYPFLDRDRARDAEGLLVAYGCELFAQLFEASSEGAYGFHRARDAGFDGYQVEIVGSTEFQRLHWEALRESPTATPLGIRVPVVRRVQYPGHGFDVQAPGATLNVLVVTARPHGASDAGYRTVSRPLMSALRQAQIPLNVDLVRPGTWEALKQHLDAVRDAKGSGWYGIVHFDVHGAVATMEQLRAAGKSKLVLAPDGADDTPDEDAYLFFETASRGSSKAVTASRVAELLSEHRVPVAVLNACQSAMQWGSEASLAQSLVQAGVPVAVGMAYSVTVTAAEKMMPEVYKQLADGKEIIAAIHKGRGKLFESRARRAYFDQELELEDWVLPVAFSQRPVQLRPRAATPAEEDEIYARKARLAGEPEPEYGFLGRDLDIQEIERRLLSDSARNEMLIHGMAGAGKSTLLAHLGWWWQATGLVDRVFRFSYEDRAWTAGQIFHEIINKLLTGSDRSLAESRHEDLHNPEKDEKLERVADLLRAERHLLVVDNAESITAAPTSIPHALPELEQQRLRRFLSRLRGGRTLVLVGSRGPEKWLANETFADNAYELGGLDPQATSELVERVLNRHHGRLPSEDAERTALEDLVTLLGGFPLALTVVLPAVAASAPSSVLRSLKSGDTDTDPQSIIQRAVELSHGRLDPAMQSSLLTLAPFTSVVPIIAFDDYHKLLRQHETVRQLGDLDIAGAVQAAIEVGLATKDSPIHVRLQPMLPYFLRTRLAEQPQLEAAITRAHHGLYEQIGPALYGLLMSNAPGERSTGLAVTRTEYANLTSAFEYSIAHGLPLQRFVATLEEYLDKSHQENARAQLLERAIEAVEASTATERRAELANLHNLAGGAALTRHALEAARLHHETELALREQLEDRQATAITYHQLGGVAEAQRRFMEAENYYKQSLEIKLEYDDRRGAASTYHQLGLVKENQGRFDEAENYYKQSLEIELENDNRYGAAVTYHQLGVVAQEQRRFGEAENYYKQALEIELEYDDRHGAALTYHQLGRVAEAQRRFVEAENYYKQALEIKLEYDDRHSAALTYHQLGTVAVEQRRLEEAENYYKQALEIKLEYDDRYSAAKSQSLLGILLTREGRVVEAIGYSLSALITRREVDGRWSILDLRLLERQRGLVETKLFLETLSEQADGYAEQILVLLDDLEPEQQPTEA